MKKISLPKRELELPDCWEDLTEKQAQFVFKQLMLLFDNKISPFEFQVSVLIHFTGYKPGLKTILRSLYRNLITLLFVKYLKRKNRLQKFIQKNQELEENIQFNLIVLAETIDFAFTIENNVIHPNYDFKRNPLGTYCSAYFNRNITIDTNITAKQYSDCVDLMRGYYDSDDKEVKRHCLIKIMLALSSKSEEEIKALPEEIPFGIMVWFTSIVRFFRDHPDFGVLYSSKKTDNPLKLDLGMSEVMLFLEKEGYQDVPDKNIISFFTAQIKSLKDSIARAVGSGAKIEDIANQTGLDFETIERLK